MHNILNLLPRNFSIQLFANDIESVSFLKILAIVSISFSLFNGDISETVITGVFGQGKTTFLYHILRKSVNKGILPIFVIARDLFEKIEAKDYGEVKRKINEIVERLKADIQNGDFSQYKQFIRSLSSKSQDELIKFYQENLDKISKSDKFILLVDELEDVYKNIKEKAGSDPLRTWLEDKSYLKILSLTPSGIYDLGGADESRLIKWNIPPVNIEYIRNKMGLSAGKANALWWLSRGVPRHIIQNLRRLKEISEKDGSYKISETLKSLERIGKEPGRVNAVEISALSDHSKIKYLINLIPQEEQPYEGFLVTKELDEGELSNIFQRMLKLVREEEIELALMVAHYFKLVAMTISDENFTAYIDKNKINEFMELVLDILLENEYKKPVVEKQMTKLLEISNELKTDPNSLLINLIKEPPQGISFVLCGIIPIELLLFPIIQREFAQCLFDCQINRNLIYHEIQYAILKFYFSYHILPFF